MGEIEIGAGAFVKMIVNCECAAGDTKSAAGPEARARSGIDFTSRRVSGTRAACIFAADKLRTNEMLVADARCGYLFPVGRARVRLIKGD